VRQFNAEYAAPDGLASLAARQDQGTATGDSIEANTLCSDLTDGRMV
jgi:hypothetical protein